jgi:hypothetical protein
MSLLWPEYLARLDAGLDLEPTEIQSVLQAPSLHFDDNRDNHRLSAVLLSDPRPDGATYYL